MNNKLIFVFLVSTFVSPVFADKPEWAGKDKPTAEQRAAHESAMENKGRDTEETMEERMNESKEKKEKKEYSDKMNGIEKQKLKKAEQEQKELQKGSQQGKTMREENRKKWWKFWGE